jgi:3-oxoacyl-[acyl-carrier protein] reductase
VDLGLENRSVIVAASSDGIARAAAEKFAAEGAKVAMCSRDAKKLNAAAGQIAERYGGQVLAEPLDVTDAGAVNEFVKHVGQEFGGIDICVTNAGGPPAKMFFATTTEEWHRAVEMNFMSVVTITSITVRQPISDLIYSNAVRAGVVGLIKSLSNEFGKDGITVNNVGPGFTATERLKQLIDKRSQEMGISPAEFKGRLGADAPMKRIGQPEEVADAIVWLASERASYITGQTLLVDGGLFKGL